MSPTAVLSGHMHSYQRFERDLGGKKVPYIVAGAGGYANSLKLLHRIETAANGKPLPDGFQTTHPELKLMKHNDQEPGFLRLTVDGGKKTATFDYFQVPFFPGKPGVAPIDSVSVPWWLSRNRKWSSTSRSPQLATWLGAYVDHPDFHSNLSHPAS